jgi:glycerophosphoryl diester phosphodiesterase
MSAPLKPPPRVALPPAFLARPIAHRALHDRAAGRPENSRAAIRAAMDAGYGIEIDVQLSSDQVAMVFHDDDLHRLTGETGPVSARDAQALGATRLTDAVDGVPTLSEVLAIVQGRVPLLIEIKEQAGPHHGLLAQAVARALKDYDGPVAIMSFDPREVAAFGQAMPDLPRGLTTCSYTAEDWPDVPAEHRATLRDIVHFDEVGGSFISHEAADLDRPRVAELKAQGATILCWTIRSPEQEAKARKVAQNITFEGYAA